MTDKQIIIDGVDVSECEYYCERYCKQVVAEDGCYVFLCAEDENCHYKKWQRKEQECSEYSKELARFQQEVVPKIRKRLRNKEQECEELRSLLKVRIEDLCDSCGASSMMPMPCKVYEKTLTEIKEIVEKGVKIHDDIIVSKQILQKISECEVMDE